MNKKLLPIALTAFVVILTAATSNAQIQKGNYLIGGNLADLNLTLTKQSGTPFSFMLTPKVAWFIKDNTAVGGYVNLGLVTQKGSTSFNYGVGPLARFYTGKGELEVVKHGRFFAEVNVGIGGSHTSVTNYDGLGNSFKQNTNTNGLDFGFGPGFSYFVTKNIGLETLLKYNGKAGFGNQGYAHNLDLNFGLQIYLPTSRLKSVAKGE